MDLFYFNDICCNEFNIEVISIKGRYSIPKKQYQSIEVPGRTGNLIIDTGAKLNKDITIKCCIDCGGLSEQQTNDKMSLISEWLVDGLGYGVLTFSDGGIFKAIVKDIVEIEHKRKDNVFVLNIIFECYEVK